MSDSSSESELLTTKNLVTFQNESTIVSVKGHNINTTNLTGLSFQNNVFTSTLNRPRNNEWQRRAESNCGQRSIGYRRETSPMSVVSACDARQRNYSRWDDTRGMNSQRSVYNGRGGSPVSMRSVVSNVSDIVMAIKNKQFNKYDIQIIKEACNQFYKHKTRKRIEKRRNLKLFLKGYLRKSGHESGELASDSSISSDDNRTTRGSNHKDKSCCRSTKTDVSDLRKSIRYDNQLKDCTDDLKQSSICSMVGGPANLDKSSVGSFRSTNKKPTSTNSMPPPQSREITNQSSTALSDRFKNGYSLPVERFNSSIAAATILEGAAGKYSESNKHQKTKPSKTEHTVQHKSPQDLNSDEEIFSEIKTTERPANLRKRSVERDDNICLPNHKRPKVSSPSKNIQSLKNSTAIEKASNDYEFAKPAFPVRRPSAKLKATDIIKAKPADMNSTDKLISKSRTLLSDNVMQPPSLPAKKVNPITQPNKVEEAIAEQSVISQKNTDASMTQSFIKRKLFTQNMDVTKKTNEIFDGSSPEKSIYDAIQKDKKKARKLVTSQCCLSRAVEPEESVILNLINKFVPDEIMNATNQSNKIVQSKLEDNDDKWDVSFIISTHNNDENVGDTFTDEDTLDADNRKLKPSPKATENKSKTTTKQIVEVLPPEVTKVTQKVLVEKSGTPNNTVQKSVKTFWDTDFESEAEGTPTTRREDFKNLCLSKKSESNTNTKAKKAGNNNKNRNQNARSNNSNGSKILDSIIYEDSITESNKSLRPVRSCRISKQNGQTEGTPTTRRDDFKNLCLSKKSESNTNTKAKKAGNNNKNRNQNARSNNSNGSKILDSIIYEDSITESNKSLRPVRSCRISKQNSQTEGTPTTRRDDFKNLCLSKKSESNTNTKAKKAGNNNKNRNQNARSNNSNGSKILDSIIYEDSITESNKSLRPVRSCRISKQNGQTEGTPTTRRDDFKNLCLSKKSESNTNTKAKKAGNNNKNRNQNARSNNSNGSKILDSIIYEDSITESNKSLRPVRSCRISKQNATPHKQG